MHNSLLPSLSFSFRRPAVSGLPPPPHSLLPRSQPPPRSRLLSRELLEFPLSFSEEEIYRAHGIQRYVEKST